MFLTSSIKEFVQETSCQKGFNSILIFYKIAHNLHDSIINSCVWQTTALTGDMEHAADFPDCSARFSDCSYASRVLGIRFRSHYQGTWSTRRTSLTVLSPSLIVLGTFLTALTPSGGMQEAIALTEDMEHAVDFSDCPRRFSDCFRRFSDWYCTVWLAGNACGDVRDVNS